MSDHRLSRRRLLATLTTAGVSGLAGCSVLQGFSADDATGEESKTDSPDPVERLWAADLSMEYTQNHHKLGFTRVDGEPVLGIPLSEYPETAGCGLVALDGTGGIRWRDKLPKEVCDPHSIGDVSTGRVDGKPALVVSTIEGETVAYDALSGDTLFAADLIETIPYSRPVITPPLADGNQRLVVFDNSANLVVAHLDGTIDWRYDAEGIGYPAPVVGDIDGDGEHEVVITTDTATGWVIALGLDGSVRWRTEFESGGRGLVGMERDGRYDIAVSTWEGQVAAVDGQSGDVRWRGQYATRGILGDYDEEHLYSTEGDGVVHAIDRTDGSLAWTVDSLSTTAPANGPVVGAGGPERGPVVAGLSYDGTLGIIDAETGAVELEHQFGPESFSSPLLVDLTDDGRDDIVVMFGDGQTEAFSLDFDG